MAQGFINGDITKLPDGHIYIEEPPLGPEPLKEIDELINGDIENQEDRCKQSCPKGLRILHHQIW